MTVTTYAKKMAKFAREENKKSERESRLKHLYSHNINQSTIGNAMPRKGVN